MSTRTRAFQVCVILTDRMLKLWQGRVHIAKVWCSKSRVYQRKPLKCYQDLHSSDSTMTTLEIDTGTFFSLINEETYKSICSVTDPSSLVH